MNEIRRKSNQEVCCVVVPDAVMPSEIPESILNEACSILFASISAALSDPAVAADFEQWKQERHRRKEAV